MTLTEADGRTTMEVLIQCVNKISRDMQIESGMEEGMQESYDDDGGSREVAGVVGGAGRRP